MRQISQLETLKNRILNLLNNHFTTPIHISQIQTQLIIHNLHFDTTLAYHFINASQSLGLLDSAFQLFALIPSPHVFITNSLIRAFSHSHTSHTPFAIYAYMHKNSLVPNNYTFPFLLKSLSDSHGLSQAQCVHTHVVKLGHVYDIYVQNSLLDVYASCGRMALCWQLFDEMLQRDVVSWTVLIMGYRNAGKCNDALIVFEKMLCAGLLPNRVTMVNALAACADFGATEMGIWIHNFIRRSRWELDVILGTSLVDMYAKCGRVGDSVGVFKSMREKNVYTWNALIKGLAVAGNGKEAIFWFNRMQQEGFKADEVTLVGVLSACSHSGLLDVGQQIFSFLRGEMYEFSPNVKHYACMVDLFTRAGHLEAAYEVIRDMPFQPTKAMWGSLLAGAKAKGNLEFGEFVARELVELEPENSAYYVLLSNIYAEMGRWGDVEKVRNLIKERGLSKDLGSSSLEIEPPLHFHKTMPV